MEPEKGASVARATAKTIIVLAAAAAIATLADARTVKASAIRARPRWHLDRAAGRSQELDALDRKGTQAKVEAASAGKKLAPRTRPMSTATTRCSTSIWVRAATLELR